MTDGETIRSFLERDHARLDCSLARAAISRISTWRRLASSAGDF